MPDVHLFKRRIFSGYLPDINSSIFIFMETNTGSFIGTQLIPWLEPEDRVLIEDELMGFRPGDFLLMVEIQEPVSAIEPDVEFQRLITRLSETIEKTRQVSYIKPVLKVSPAFGRKLLANYTPEWGALAVDHTPSEGFEDLHPSSHMEYVIRLGGLVLETDVRMAYDAFFHCQSHDIMIFPNGTSIFVEERRKESVNA